MWPPPDPTHSPALENECKIQTLWLHHKGSALMKVYKSRHLLKGIVRWTLSSPETPFWIGRRSSEGQIYIPWKKDNTGRFCQSCYVCWVSQRLNLVIAAAHTLMEVPSNQNEQEAHEEQEGGVLVDVVWIDVSTCRSLEYKKRRGDFYSKLIKWWLNNSFRPKQQHQLLNI